MSKYPNHQVSPNQLPAAPITRQRIKEVCEALGYQIDQVLDIEMDSRQVIVRTLGADAREPVTHFHYITD